MSDGALGGPGDGPFLQEIVQADAAQVQNLPRERGSGCEPPQEREIEREREREGERGREREGERERGR